MKRSANHENTFEINIPCRVIYVKSWHFSFRISMFSHIFKQHMRNLYGECAIALQKKLEMCWNKGATRSELEECNYLKWHLSARHTCNNLDVRLKRFLSFLQFLQWSTRGNICIYLTLPYAIFQPRKNKTYKRAESYTYICCF